MEPARNMEASLGASYVQDAVPASVRRVSWGAVVAGVVVTLVVQLMFGILGIGIGASTIDPLQESNPTSGIGFGTGVWFLITGLLALYAGGWTAGRLAGVPRTTESVLHGVLTWGLATLLTFYFLTSSVGALIGGTARMLGRGVSMAGQGAAAIAPQVGDSVKNQLSQRGIDWGAIEQEARTLLQQTGKPELQPGNLGGQAGAAAGDATNAAKGAGTDPLAADTEFRDALNRVFNRSGDVASAADRDALINVVAARTGKSRDEATQIVANWERTYNQARDQYNQLKEKSAQTAREVGDTAARGVSKAAFWSFIVMLGGLSAAAFGAYTSVPEWYGPAYPPRR